MTPVEVNIALLQILQLRNSPAYHAAEVMRREIGETAMANSPAGSEAFANIHLLIGTWETIAALVRANPELREPFYKVNPVGHMWQALAPAIEIVRGRTVTVMKGKRRITRKLGRLYARQFQLLDDEYTAWLSGKPADYQTAALGGIQALFG
ncbi:MAG: hypothetical protein AB1773_07865 [Pseudomonadota bacterium]